MRQQKKSTFHAIREMIHRVLVFAGSVGLTLVFFLVLPLLQALNKPPSTGTLVQSVDTVLEAPDPPPEPEPEEPPEPEEEPPPELTEQSQPLDLSQLELAMNPGLSGGWMSGDFGVNLDNVVNQNKDVDQLFSLADLDQKPRVVYQPSPAITKEVKKHAPGTVYLVFIVNKEGKVEQPKVQKSTAPVFEKPALNAVKQWKFEPGKRGGEAVRFRMRVPITFPKG